MPTYEAALHHWERTPLPGAKRRGSSIWRDNQRPLDDARKWHYRLERGFGDYFDVCLYHTTMSRLWKPEADGSRRIDYTNHSSPTSSQFMWRVTRCQAIMKYGNTLVPIAYKELGTTIWLDKDDNLLTDRSHHEPVYRKVTSPEQKAWRKTMKASMQNLTTLFELGMDVLEADTSSWKHAGKPFKGADIKWADKQQLRYFDGEVTESTTHLQIEALKHIWDACLQFLVDRRDYAATPPSWGRRETKEHKAPTPQEVTRSFYGQIEKLCCRESSGRERIPDWPTELPTKFYF